MKKKLIIILAILNIVSLCFMSINTAGLSQSEPLLYKEIKDINDIDTFENIYLNNIKIDSTESKQSDVLLNNLFNIKDYLSKINVSFDLMSRKEMLDYASAINVAPFAGLYNQNTKTIIIVEKDTDTSVHEVGHAVYFQILTEADRTLITKLYPEEKNGLLDEYGRESLKEFFAVAFTEYIYSPETLKVNCPKTFEFIDDLNNEVSK